MFFLPWCRVPKNIYSNTYGQSAGCISKYVVANYDSFEVVFTPLGLYLRENVTTTIYYVVAVLKRDLSGADTPQYRGNAVLRDLARTYYLFRKMRNTFQTNRLLYSVKDAAELLSLSRGTIYKLIDSGRLIAVYPTTHARISADSLRRYVANLERSQRESELQLKQVLL